MTTIHVEREKIERWLTGLQCGVISQRHVFDELRTLLAEQPQASAAQSAPVVPGPVEMGELRVRLESGHKQFEFEEYSAAYALPDGTHYLYAASQPARHDQANEVRWLREALKSARNSLFQACGLAADPGICQSFRKAVDRADAALTHSQQGEAE